ncbi:unnamed protein product [Sphagnum compactum]
MQQRDIISSSVVMAPARITCVMHLDLFRVYKVMAILVACICTSNFTAAQTTNIFTNVTSVPVGLTLTVADRASSLPAVPLETNNFMFSLEGGPCRLTIRHLYSSITSWLLWNANYFVKPLPPAPGRKCTLKFTTTGDLQLLAGNTLIWHSGTAGKGVTTMSLATVGDYGNFRLLDAKNRTVWQSFDYPEFAIIPTQKFRPGQTLVAPTTLPTGAFSGGVYSLEFQNGDLRLYSNFGSGPKLYWSLQRKLFHGDLSSVAYAAMVPNVGGLGLFRSDGSIVFNTPALPPFESNAHDNYFSVDADGNLRTYFLVKGLFWQPYYQVLETGCEYPSFCGAYGICSNNQTCTCPTSFKPINATDLTQGCRPPGSPIACSSSTPKKFLKLTGYDYVYNQYSQPLQVPVSKCNQLCLQDCSCVAYFYYSKASFCFLIDGELRTIQKISDSTKLAFIKVQA